MRQLQTEYRGGRGRSAGRWSLKGCLLGTAVMACGLSAITMPMVTPASALAATAPSQKLINDADLFMHYSLVGNVKLATAFGKVILKMSPSPVDALHAFEAAANGRNVSEILIDNQQVPALRKISAKISALLYKGHMAVARNPNRIMQAIAAMDQSPRAFVVSRERLRAAGEFAVPFYIHTLNSESKKALHPYVLQMMSDIGKPVINPLVEQLATTSVAERVQIIHVLGDIQYPQSLAYLKQIAEDKAAPADERAAAVSAIDKIDPTGLYSHLNAAQQFLWLAKGYFNHRPSLAPNYPNEATNPIWFYDPQLGDVSEVAVPTPIWYDVQCMRACKAALRLEPNLSPAISLWITANLRREVNLPHGMTDPSLPKNAPAAAYYAVAAGPRYLNPSLREALAIDNSRLILKVIKALTETGGVAGLVSSPASPLLQAMSYPNLQVRFEAAAALSAANPLKPYPGYNRVVPILSEALAQSGKPVCVVIEPSAQDRNSLAAGLRSKFHIISASTTSQAFEMARQSPIINLVVVQGAANVRNYTQLATTDARLAYTPLVILAHSTAAREYRVEFTNEQTVNVLPVGSSANEVQTVYQNVIDKLGGSIPSSLKLADALGAAHQLKLIAMNRASIYSVLPALPALHAALHNGNSKVVLAAARVLGRVRDPMAQRMLVRAALHSSGAATEVRAALFRSLATSARNLGDDLTRGQIHGVIRIAMTDPSAQVKLAAAQALGALNIPSNQASTLILGNKE
jgi:HEAT repeat protein